ncbi:Chitin synthase, class 6, partial [Coemansia sp. RSA 2610]
HRLLFIICDGNIVGSGNDRPTPRIVLDILGVDPKLDPPARSFRSIGEGGQQHNMAKVYSGLYEYEGHVVPYLVVAKIGKPTEKSRPGNRGKRDSQMLLLHFLNRVHFEAPMSPLDLEIYHQMKNVIGVHPSLYEYLMMVDADTEVFPDSLTRLVACMVHDAKVIGICGETQLTNEDFSWTTMIQVYEYFISHHMAKAFESLFGSVTCLPGCFCMYRLRTARGMPLIISKNVINDYSENHVDTLHKKNLLSLGEDRYLTTLMMKYFPQFKMTFTADAKCKTTAPDTWSILLSQRRRWINSTVHNLVELVFLPEMCGFCCFSMRFVVFIDLFGTLTMPCTLFYLAYLAYLAITKIADIGYISLILIGAIYGLQAVIFVLKRQWQHIGWMIIYILAYPLWSFFIPIYAFWHMDDFSWGNTRIVVGDDGKRQIFVKDEEPFNPDEIPMKSWAEYEGEIFKRQQQIQEMEAVAQAIDDFGNNSVRPVSRFTHIPGVDSQPAMMPTPTLGMPAQQQQRPYSSAGFSAYFGSMNMGTPQMQQHQPVATSSYNLVQAPDGNMPSDQAIATAILSILETADLSTITMKQVRDELCRMFNMDLSSRREFINHTVQSMLPH